MTSTHLIKQHQGLRGLTPILKEVLPWVKCYQIALHSTETLFLKGRVNDAANSIVVLF